MRGTGSPRVRRVSTAAGLCLLATTLLTGYTTSAVPTAASPAGSSWSDTQPVTRETTATDGTAEVDKRVVTVTADRTRES